MDAGGQNQLLNQNAMQNAMQHALQGGGFPAGQQAPPGPQGQQAAGLQNDGGMADPNLGGGVPLDGADLQGNAAFQQPAMAGQVQALPFAAGPAQFMIMPNDSEFADTMKQFQMKMREDSIAKEVAKQPTAAAKRIVGFLVRSIYQVQDIKKEMASLKSDAALANTEIATADNLPMVNLAIYNQDLLLDELLTDIRKEYTMQVTANISSQKWSLVKHMEHQPIFNEELSTMTYEQLRELEREKMKIDRKTI